MVFCKVNTRYGKVKIRYLLMFLQPVLIAYIFSCILTYFLINVIDGLFLFPCGAATALEGEADEHAYHDDEIEYGASWQYHHSIPFFFWQR